MLTERNEYFYQTKLLHYMEPLVNPDNESVVTESLHDSSSFNYFYTAPHDRLAVTVLRESGICIVEHEGSHRTRYKDVEHLVKAMRLGRVRIKEVKRKKK
uniref:Uncharacterized protein n=1 Tax=Ochrobactrum phage ORM_20 TaxID=2985243 RepID=A0A9N6WTW4_9VIRU|nr:hypothetical protein ORM20_00250 [Ochrobactrum phage ORM_20]